MTLTERRAQLLSLIISEYVDTATPVGSDAIVRRFELPFSSATIRNATITGISRNPPSFGRARKEHQLMNTNWIMRLGAAAAW